MCAEHAAQIPDRVSSASILLVWLAVTDTMEALRSREARCQEAVAWYCRVLENISRTPDGFDPDFTQQFADLIAKLDPSNATSREC